MDDAPPTWDALRARLTTELRSLPDGGFVVFGEPDSRPARRTGLRGLLGGRRTTPTRFVQARRDGDQLGVECIGATLFGGLLAIDPETDAKLRSLGWLAPGDPGYEPMGGPYYRRWLPVADTTSAATLLIESLAALGMTEADPLELSTGS